MAFTPEETEKKEEERQARMRETENELKEMDSIWEAPGRDKLS